MVGQGKNRSSLTTAYMLAAMLRAAALVAELGSGTSPGRAMPHYEFRILDNRRRHLSVHALERLKPRKVTPQPLC
jgi:hypothetical protein